MAPLQNPWITYQKERFPLGSYGLLSLGIGAQGAVIGSASLGLDRVLVASCMAGIFFAVLRLMDEVKDVAKDRVAHPERPLARGLIEVDAARRTILMGLGAMTALAATLGLFYGWQPAVLYAGTTGYLWLMYKEFYIGAWLSRMPLFYAATHQLILLPLTASGAALSPVPPAGMTGVSHLVLGGIQILPAFFAYEVGRKMAPGAHPILGGYRTVYGLRRCQMILAGLGLLSCYGLSLAIQSFPFSGLNPVMLWVILGVFFASPLAISLIRGDKGAKAVEAAATLNLLVSMYAPVVAYIYLRVVGVVSG